MPIQPKQPPQSGQDYMPHPPAKRATSSVVPSNYMAHRPRRTNTNRCISPQQSSSFPEPQLTYKVQPQPSADEIVDQSTQI